MANWAYTNYVIEGPKELLEKINIAIIDHPVSEGADEHWEGDILNALGCKWVSRNDDRENGKYMRGFIRDEPWWGDEEHTLLRFDAEEAWGATDLNEVLEEHFPDIKVFYQVEEEGEGIYATNDKEGKYFPERYYVDTCIDGDYYSEYFRTEEEVLSWLELRTNGRVKTFDDVETFNADYEDSGTDDENYIFVHEFNIVE